MHSQPTARILRRRRRWRGWQRRDTASMAGVSKKQLLRVVCWYAGVGAKVRFQQQEWRGWQRQDIASMAGKSSAHAAAVWRCKGGRERGCEAQRAVSLVHVLPATSGLPPSIQPCTQPHTTLCPCLAVPEPSPALAACMGDEPPPVTCHQASLALAPCTHGIACAGFVFVRSTLERQSSKSMKGGGGGGAGSSAAKGFGAPVQQRPVKQGMLLRQGAGAPGLASRWSCIPADLGRLAVQPADGRSFHPPP